MTENEINYIKKKESAQSLIGGNVLVLLLVYNKF